MPACVTYRCFENGKQKVHQLQAALPGRHRGQRQDDAPAAAEAARSNQTAPLPYLQSRLRGFRRQVGRGEELHKAQQKGVGQERAARRRQSGN